MANKSEDVELPLTCGSVRRDGAIILMRRGQAARCRLVQTLKEGHVAVESCVPRLSTVILVCHVVLLLLAVILLVDGIIHR